MMTIARVWTWVRSRPWIPWRLRVRPVLDRPPIVEEARTTTIAADPPLVEEPPAPTTALVVAEAAALPAAPVDEQWAPRDSFTTPTGAPLETWHLRTTILDRLGEYFVCMRRLQRKDPASYQLFSRIGFAVPADRYRNPDHPQTREDLRAIERRSFGGILTGGLAEEHPGRAYPAFAYFQKLAHASSVQAVADGDIYRFTCLWDDRDPTIRWAATSSAIATCHVRLCADGTVELLKELRTTHATIVHRTGRHGRGRRERLDLSTRQWCYPAWIDDLSDERGWGADLVRMLFGLSMLTYDAATSRVVIRAEHGDVAAAFGIALTRAPYFFADRDLTDGRKKRIFHAVRAHQRTLATLRTTEVRAHYRGVRDFEWNGHHIHIVLPEQTDVLRLPVPARYREDIPAAERRDTIGLRGVGERLRDELSQ